MLGRGGLSLLSGALGMGLQYLKYRRQTITEFTARFFEPGTRLFTIFKGMGYPDMCAWILGGAMVTVLHDYWTVKEGMQSGADTLSGRFRSLGGELRLKTKVDRIITRGGYQEIHGPVLLRKGASGHLLSLPAESAPGPGG